MHLLCLLPAAPPPRGPRLPSLPPALPGRRCREEGGGGGADPTWRQKTRRVRVSQVRVTAGQPTPTPQLPPEDKEFIILSVDPELSVEFNGVHY